jgi:CysZ protein|tara:strand:+ start:34006 stop:34719 length:714 start_codon:yes stop_codon:yes gene_type:complete
MRHLLLGLRLLRHPQLRRFVLIPLVINSLLLGTTLWWAMTSLFSYLENLLPSWLAWAQWLILPIVFIGFSLFIFQIFGLVANLIAAPFNNLLSERAERLLRPQGIVLATSQQAVLKRAFSDVLKEFEKLRYFLLRAAPLIILFFIPGLNLVASLLWFVFSAWMLSLEYLDYPLSNHDRSFQQSRLWVKQHRGVCWRFGFSASVLSLIPILNFLLMPAAVVAATAIYSEVSSHPETAD